MADECWSFYRPESGTCRTRTFSSGNSVCQSDSIFFGNPWDEFFDTRYLIPIERIVIIFTEDHDTDGSEIVVEGMSTSDIVTTRAPLIDLATLTDDIVICDITPFIIQGMILVDIADCFFVRLPILEWGSLMMDDDTRDLFCILTWPTEHMPTLTIDLSDDTSRCTTRIFQKLYTCITESQCLELCGCLG
jgi:hypothetical protein